VQFKLDLAHGVACAYVAILWREDAAWATRRMLNGLGATAALWLLLGGSASPLAGVCLRQRHLGFLYFENI